jgi:hypothetical protein
MGQVYLDAQVEVLLPVKVKMRFAVSSKDDFDPEQAIKKFLKGKDYRKTNVTFGKLEVVGIHNDNVSEGDEIGFTVSEIINEGINGTFENKLLALSPAE